jgi:hypothetical protein
MTVLSWLGFAAGLVLVLTTLASVTVTLVVPRGLRSRLTNAVTAAITGGFRFIASRRPRYEDRDRLLSLAGPTVLIGLVISWVSLLYVGFGLMLWPFVDSFPGGLTVAGSSMFTLGFATAPGAGPTALIFLSAAVGLVVVALQIAYLPTLYSAFNRRETLVTLLESRGGVPAWGPEILARHELIDSVASLPELYRRWEEWAADVAETHTTYQVLVLFRSPHPMRSWITALLSVLDAAALQLSLNPLTAPAEARPLMRMGYMALRELAGVMRIAYNTDPHPDDAVLLPREDFDEALEHLESVGWRIERSADEAWVHFRGWRVTYERIAWTIADLVDAPPSLWSGVRHQFGTAGVAPFRPPHRSPMSERSQVQAITSARRSVRDGSAVPLLRNIGGGRRRGVVRPPAFAEAEDRADMADAAAEEPAD